MASRFPSVLHGSWHGQVQFALPSRVGNWQKPADCGCEFRMRCAKKICSIARHHGRIE